MNPSDWAHSLVQIAGVLIPIFIYMQRNARIAKRERNRQHEENQILLTDIKNEREFFPPHIHMESTGPLRRENMRFRRTKDGYFGEKA